MRSEVKDIKAEYPYLGVENKNGLIVLFNSPCTGVAVHRGTSKYGTGTYDNEWAEQDFVVFNGVLELSN